MMNRAEAIEFAKEQQEIFGGKMGEFLEFVENELTQTNASNALNALDCVDTISRQAAIDGFYEMASDIDYLCTVGDYIKFLESLSSAEPKKGKWEPFDLTYGRRIFFCTACNNAAEVPTDFGKPMFKFCPWCGARMKGADDE